MYTILRCCLLILWIGPCQGQQPTEQPTPSTTGPIGGHCEGCELIFAGLPDRLSARDTSSIWHGDGPRVVMTGTVFAPDGTTPAPGVILYYWQTDRTGRYEPDETVPRAARSHGRVRGWVKTGSDGRYAIHTVRPAGYPGRSTPEHIHVVVLEPDLETPYYIDDLLFTDDPRLTEQVLNQRPDRGGSGVVTLAVRDSVGYAERDIILGLNIPHHPARN